jgi:hypothetical protein
MCRAAAAMLVLASLAVAVAPSAAEESPSGGMTLVGDRLSLHAREASLQSILDDIADRTGLRVRLDTLDAAAALQQRVTIVLDQVPVEAALLRLLRDTDFVLLYSPRGVAEVRVYGAGQRAAVRESPPAPSVSASPPQANAPDTAAVAGLRNQALADPDSSVRGRALEGLAAKADQPAARDAVMEVLERETNPGLLERALDIVGGDQSIPLEPIVKLAVSNPAPQVRIKALSQLGQHVTRDPQARRTLEVLAADDPAPPVREAAQALLRRATVK